MRISDWSSDVCSSDLGQVRKSFQKAMVYYLNKSLLHRPLTRQIQGTQLARVHNLTLTISDRAAAMKPSASIAAKKIVSDLQASGHEITDLTIGDPDIADRKSVVWGRRGSVRL